MELKINDYQLPQPIEFNYDEILAWVQERTEIYKNMIYDDTQISQAKSDRAALRRVAIIMNDRRISLEKEYMQPFFEFKEKINALIKLIDEPAKLIDARIKEYEKAKQDEKTAEITEYFNSIADKPEWLTISMLWNPKWLNATKSMRSVKDEINLALDGIKNDLATLAEIKDFGFEATEEYKRSLDINRALAEGMRLSEIQKRKEAEAKAREEAEARRKEAEIAAYEEEMKHAPSYVPEMQTVSPTMNQPGRSMEASWEEEQQPAQWVAFEALITAEQGRLLGQFCKANGIQIRPIGGGQG